MSKFYDLSNSASGIADKSNIDIYDDDPIPLCDICKNIRLLPYQDTKLICPECGHIENPKYEHIQTQAQETTLDEIGGRGEISYQVDSISQRKTKNRLENNHENLDYVNREFDKVRQIELVDKEVRKPYKRLQQ